MFDQCPNVQMSDVSEFLSGIGRLKPRLQWMRIRTIGCSHELDTWMQSNIYMSEMKGHRGLPFGIFGKISNTLV